MSELTLVLIRFAYLALLWLFVLATVTVIRSDMFGAKVAKPAKTAKQRQQKPAKPKRGEPTVVQITAGGNQGEAFSLDRAPLLIGRGSEAAIKLDDDYVSTRHARIARSADQWFVEDLGSTNGTYVGARRITQPTVIGIGSQIRIGKTMLELRK